MLKKQLTNIIKHFGKPLYIASQHSGSSWCPWEKDYYVEISWGKDKNTEIMNRCMLQGGAWLKNWTNSYDIVVKSFRHNGAKISAKKRANDYIVKINKWMEVK